MSQEPIDARLAKASEFLAKLEVFLYIGERINVLTSPGRLCAQYVGEHSRVADLLLSHECNQIPVRLCKTSLHEAFSAELLQASLE